MKKSLPILLWISYQFITGRAFADVVTLKDGRQISGLVESGAMGEIRVKVMNDMLVVAVDQIHTIQFSQPLSQQGTVAPDPAPGAVLPDPAPSMAVPTQPQTITVPVGTEISVRTIDRIESKKADLHKEYAASLDDPIVVNGVAVVPANASAFLRVSDVQSPGFTRRAALSLSLVAVMINGRRVTVEAGKVDSKGGSQAKRTATGALAGAGAGAVIGVLAGGALGAGVGAGVGAVGGSIAGRMSGKGVEIASETRFTYRLSQQLVIDYPAGAQ